MSRTQKYLATVHALAASHIHLLAVVRTSHGMHSAHSDTAHYIDVVGDEEQGTKWKKREMG